MEEDVRPPPHERRDVDGESLVEPDVAQLSQNHPTEQQGSRTKAATTPDSRDAPKSPFSRLPRTVIEQ